MSVSTIDSSNVTFVAVCALDRLTANRGIAALLNGHAVAVFRLGDDTIAVIDNIDPCSGASVLSRGVVGEFDGVPTVASPMYKQRFNLHTGRCLDAQDTAVTVHAARVTNGIIEVALNEHALL